MKKKLLFVLLFAMMLSLTACAAQPLPDDFDQNTETNTAVGMVASILRMEDSDLTALAHNADAYFTSENLGYDVDIITSISAGTITAKEEAGDPVTINVTDITYEANGSNVVITVPVEFTERIVDYEFTFVQNEIAQYDANEESYILSQVVVSAQYSLGELMEKAGMNTLMGMGVVFLVLIFISLVISLFKFMPGSGAKKQTKKSAAKPTPVAATPAPAVKASAADENLMNDQELVAVITAAVMAASGSGTATTSSDKLVVRSIKRAAR